MTGNILLNKPIANRQEQLDKTLAKYQKKKFTNKYNILNNGKFTLPKETFLEGRRNNELARWAGVLNTKNVSQDEYLYYLHEINNQCCSPSLDKNEVNAIANSIRRYRT